MKNFSGIVGGLVLVAGAGAWALQFGTAGAVKKRAAVVAGERNEQLMDPWNAPLGAPVEGAVLSDGWRDLVGHHHPDLRYCRCEPHLRILVGRCRG